MSGNPHKPPKSSSGPIITVLVIILAGALYLGWNYLNGNGLWPHPQDTTDPKVSWLKNPSPDQKTAQTAETELSETTEQSSLHLTPGKAPALDETQELSEPPNECLQTADKMLLFFEHLDRQKYIQEYNIKGSTLEHMAGIINKLMANPPVVVRETDDLFAILNNMTHFFRVLGPKNILLIKDVLVQEQELIEPTMALFYKWSEIEPNCTDNPTGIKLPLSGLYEYAGYFINTLGGQSYLFRRAIYLRLLFRYYSVLIVDRANNADINRYGIDLRYTLDALTAEIESNRDLENSQQYLEILTHLQESYQARYGKR